LASHICNNWKFDPEALKSTSNDCTDDAGNANRQKRSGHSAPLCEDGLNLNVPASFPAPHPETRNLIGVSVYRQRRFVVVLPTTDPEINQIANQSG
jgi:hypothetical protein